MRLGTLWRRFGILLGLLGLVETTRICTDSRGRELELNSVEAERILGPDHEGSVREVGVAERIGDGDGMEVKALGRSFHLKFRHNPDLLHPQFVHVVRGGGGVEEVGRGMAQSLTSCFVHAHVTHHPLGKEKEVAHGAAALDLCGGLKGVILSGDGENDFSLHPLPARFNSSAVLVWPTRKSTRTRRSSRSYTPLGAPTDSYWLRYRSTDTPPFRRSGRPRFLFHEDYEDKLAALSTEEDLRRPPKRSLHRFTEPEEEGNSVFGQRIGRPPDSGENLVEKVRRDLTVETAVFVDKDLFAHMEANFGDEAEAEVTRVVLAMVNAVQLLYGDPSLGRKVRFVLKRLEVLREDPPGLLRPFDIDRFLTSFCKWQRGENKDGTWDHALILTGLDLYVVHGSGKVSNQVVGLAPVAGMCTRSSSCTVNEGRHFESVYVVAHEIGHNLGMRHDGPGAGNDCDPTSHIMSPTLGSGKITWSPCSQKYLDSFLETPQAKCLFDSGEADPRLAHDADGRLPGQRFDADKQCVLKYGKGSFHAGQQPIEDVCRDLHCRRDHYTWTSHPALEGTFCGKGMWCRGGKCVAGEDEGRGSETAASSSGHAVEGGWGSWSPFTECSSSCLDDSTGIRLAARRCDSPRPQNGGAQCYGPDRKYKTCRPQKVCEPGGRDRTVEGYAKEVCARAALADNELTGLGFMTNTNDPERACSVWCGSVGRDGSRSRGWSFPDGTACRLLSRPGSSTFCVAGKCQEFACDGSTHFSLSEDECGKSRVGRSGWGNWESRSQCRPSCLALAKGLEVVERPCTATSTSNCPGLRLSLRLCKPSKATILELGCRRLETPFEHASKICRKYSAKVRGLSGIGMQLSATKGEVDRPCRIGCQDSNIPYRFYMVNGEEGQFPPGTDCSRGDSSRKAYCLAGKCIEFGADDTPEGVMSERDVGALDGLFSRTKREIPGNWSAIPIDFSRPKMYMREEEENSPLEGSFYEWRKSVSDCSVTCGSGMREVVVECVSGSTTVDASLCSSDRRPGISGFIPCLAPCPPNILRVSKLPASLNFLLRRKSPSTFSYSIL